MNENGYEGKWNDIRVVEKKARRKRSLVAD